MANVRTFCTHLFFLAGFTPGVSLQHYFKQFPPTLHHWLASLFPNENKCQVFFLLSGLNSAILENGPSGGCKHPSSGGRNWVVCFALSSAQRMVLGKQGCRGEGGLKIQASEGGGEGRTRTITGQGFVKVLFRRVGRGGKNHAMWKSQHSEQACKGMEVSKAFQKQKGRSSKWAKQSVLIGRYSHKIHNLKTEHTAELCSYRA